MNYTQFILNEFDRLKDATECSPYGDSKVGELYLSLTNLYRKYGKEGLIAIQEAPSWRIQRK